MRTSNCHQTQHTPPMSIGDTSDLDGLVDPMDFVHTVPLTLTLVSLLSYDTPEKKKTTL